MLGPGSKKHGSGVGSETASDRTDPAAEGNGTVTAAADKDPLVSSLSALLVGGTGDAAHCSALAMRLLFSESDDGRKAVALLKRAAFQVDGHVRAQAVLGFCYEFGLGVESDSKFAESLYLSAAMRGDGLAGARLSFLRRYGRPHVKIDRAEAEEWIKRVNEMGPSAVQWLQDAADSVDIVSAMSPAHAAANYALGEYGLTTLMPNTNFSIELTLT
ncbi:hypothetical protein BC830DRAFT_58529 [Chytriomyces sp. MP71]|nr:hypothetical protein BC830DRAFT_58529 [Chytriomyces sp. MP71]